MHASSFAGVPHVVELPKLSVTIEPRAKGRCPRDTMGSGLALELRREVSLMAKSKLSLRGVDLFCGPGGFTIGCKRAGVSTICAVDHSADAIETFRRHTRDADVFCKDISAVPRANHSRTVGTDAEHPTNAT